MKIIWAKYQKTILELKKQEKRYFVLKSIFQNFAFFMLIRWNACQLLEFSAKINSKVSIIFCCVYTVNKKRFTALMPFSRYVLFKLSQAGQISGLKKASW